MINLDDILDQWSKDCEIDKHDLFEESRKVPNLHAKYLQLYSYCKLHHRKAENNLQILLKHKWLYYNGKMDQSEVRDHNWDPDPFDGLKVLKQDMDYWYNSDPDIIALNDKVHYYKTCLDTLKDIIDNCKWRHQTIKNMIEWRRFEQGG